MKALLDLCGLGLPGAWLKRLAPVALIAAACVASAPEAQASPVVMFILDSIMLADGGTATGSFQIDEGTGYVFDGNVTVTDANAVASPDVFNNSTVTSEFDANNLSFAIFSNNGDGFVLNFQNALAATSDPVSSGYYSYTGANGAVRTAVTSGSVNVPEPAAVLLLGAALGLMLSTRKTFRVALQTFPKPA